MTYFFFFFFQAEDGIRDLTVTGVQTCALPISSPLSFKRLSSSIAPDQFLAAICARTAESLSGAGCGLGAVSAAKALVANSSAPVIRMRVMVFMSGSVVEG